MLAGLGIMLCLSARAEQPDTQAQVQAQLAKELEQRVSQSYPDIQPQDYDYDIQVQSAVASLEHCPQSPAVDWRNQALDSRLTPRIRCEPLGWQVFVPITLSIRQPVVVAASALSRGQSLSVADLALRSEDIGSLRMGYYHRPEDLKGFQVARNLRQGDVIHPYVVEAPTLIKRGDRVVILAESGGLTVRALGEALRDGEAGRQIPVRNLNSGSVVHAYIRERGVVAISVQ
ncbi:MAG: flagellar basal body P-ring formation chaperone FlgA [Saccharospirillum sp.]